MDLWDLGKYVMRIGNVNLQLKRSEAEKLLKETIEILDEISKHDLDLESNAAEFESDLQEKITVKGKSVIKNKNNLKLWDVVHRSTLKVSQK